MQVSERTIEDVREALRHEPISAYPDFVAAVSAALDDRETLPVELDGVADAIAYGKGVWRSCSGCHETNEGVPLGPYSSILKCHLGGGCFECGGVGAIWDTTDYEEMGRFLSGEALATSPASSGVEGERCPICAEAFKPTDLCASDIEMGTCHAACLEGSPVVDLETGEPSDGPISTYRFDEDAPAAPTAIDSIATEGPWQWWAGSTEEWCTVGPEASREAIIQAAINDCLGEGEDDVGAWTLNFHIVEARQDPLRLADWIESDRLIERAEDNVADSDRAAGEYDDGPFFRVAPEIEKDLEERIKRACDEWQLANGLTFTCRTFSHTRNDEDVVVDHPNATSEGPVDV
ncbi:hypothetical protein [Rhizobium subbaraonis]|nr:hypothetical protein [Rhizobium subbaraonis]